VESCKCLELSMPPRVQTAAKQAIRVGHTSGTQNLTGFTESPDRRRAWHISTPITSQACFVLSSHNFTSVQTWSEDGRARTQSRHRGQRPTHPFPYIVSDKFVVGGKENGYCPIPRRSLRWGATELCESGVVGSMVSLIVAPHLFGDGVSALGSRLIVDTR
jgi:hypothetical protein